MFFVLNGTEQQLYYFENQKVRKNLSFFSRTLLGIFELFVVLISVCFGFCLQRSKPKGLIDLSYSSLYPVHDSFFGRPNCFQLVVRALNHVSVYYICADNSDQAQVGCFPRHA